MKSSRFIPFLCAGVAALMLASSPVAAAQQQQTFPDTPQGRSEKYASDMRDLARVLGGAHYLRILCLGNVDQSWRDFMRDMMAQERPRTRQELVELFNVGYRAEEQRFPVCSPAAQLMEADLKKRGMRLADWLAAYHKD